ncbi:MAG: FN3 associated domain-containing protein, partial [Planctomycetota bacterium]
SGDSSLGTDWADVGYNDSAWAIQPTTNLHFGEICDIKGLNYEYFEGYWSYVPDFDSLTPEYVGIVDTFDITPRQRNDYFGFRFIGFIEVSLNGVYTFYTTSDDGSLLFIDGYLIVYNDGRHDMEERSGSIYLDAGMHPIRVEYFDYSGDDGLIVSYEGPGIPKKAIPYDVLCSGTVTNEMQNQMQYTNASLWTRIEFEVEDPEVFDMLALRIRYEDGFMAFLNGQEVEWRNSPDSVQWNSTALSNRPIEDSSVFVEINLMAYLDLLLPKPQKNVLAIQGLNDDRNNGEFRILPELVAAMNRAVPQYFTTPTPGTFNISGAMGAVSDVWLSTERTFYTGPPDWHIDLTLSTGTDGAEIRYTLDGSLPTIIHGTPYNPQTDPPLEIDETTVLRAVAVKPGWLDSKVETHTYIFLDDVIHQPNLPGDFPANWGHTGSGDYGMDPEVVSVHGVEIKNDLRDIPTLSLAMDVNDWFKSGGQGIYIEGELSERAVSAELIFPDGTEGFQIDCAVMIVGGSSVNRWKMDKLSMRLKFKGEYGPTELRFPVFGENATDEFDTIVLDARMNNSWGYGGGVLAKGTRPWISGRSVYQRDIAQYTRDQFVSDIQNAMGGYSAYGRHVHLYLNGLYWGLYWLHERPDEHFAAAYLGGDDDDYDILKHNSYTVINGSSANYNEMFTVAEDGLASNTQYELIQEYLDVPNLIDYMITNFYVGNTDWDHHNWYATRSRVDPDGRWRYHSWDAEHVMENLSENVIGRNNSGCPTRLHQRLSQNSEYRLLFADHVHRHLFNDGVLTPEGATALYNVRLNEVDRAVVGESARWGDNQIDRHANIRYMRDPHWLLERDWMLNTYFPERTGIVLDDLNSGGLYPDVNAPVFYINGSYQHGGPVLAGDDLSMDNTNPFGDIYYTLDGTDPRQPISGNAVGTKYNNNPVTLNKTSLVKARVRVDNITWSALNEAIFAIGPVVENLRITEIMYHPLFTGNLHDPNEEYIELKNIGPDTLNLNLVRFTEGIDFTFPDMELDPDEFVVVVKNQSAFEAQYGISVNMAGQYIGSLANNGERIQLVDAIGRTILDFEYKDGWRSITDGDGFSLTIIDSGGGDISGSDEGLVAHWKFDDGSGITAIDSTGTNNGTLNGDPTWTTGRVDGALSFDGDGDYVAVAPIAALTGDTLTAQAWIRLDEF